MAYSTGKTPTVMYSTMWNQTSCSARKRGTVQSMREVEATTIAAVRAASIRNEPFARNDPFWPGQAHSPGSWPCLGIRELNTLRRSVGESGGRVDAFTGNCGPCGSEGNRLRTLAHTCIGIEVGSGFSRAGYNMPSQTGTSPPALGLACLWYNFENQSKLIAFLG